SRSMPVVPLRMLFLVAQPGGLESLNAGAAHRAIKEAVSSAGGRVSLTSAWAVQSSDVQRDLIEHRPHVLHVHVHGDARGKLVLESAGGRPVRVPPDVFANLLRTMAQDLRLVFFAAPHTESLAKAAAAAVGLAIGMRGEIEEKATVELAASFYRGI